MTFTLDIDMLVPQGPNDARPFDPRFFARTNFLARKRSCEGGLLTEPSLVVLEKFTSILPLPEPDELADAIEQETFRLIWFVRRASQSIVPDISLRGTKPPPCTGFSPP